MPTANLGASLTLFDVAVRTLAFVPYPALRLATTSAVYFGLCLPLWSLTFRERSLTPAAPPRG